ncbi:hypothetical protein, partial [Burkholderia ubonensis]|uniref:hypothetical protein n=1 Tax=Burkholderia ubonensis TaxID=101571 RepID=UPI0012FACBEF
EVGEVKGRDAYVKVDANGHKHDTTAGDPDGLPFKLSGVDKNHHIGSSVDENHHIGSSVDENHHIGSSVDENHHIGSSVDENHHIGSSVDENHHIGSSVDENHHIGSSVDENHHIGSSVDENHHIGSSVDENHHIGSSVDENHHIGSSVNDAASNNHNFEQMLPDFDRLSAQDRSGDFVSEGNRSRAYIILPAISNDTVIQAFDQNMPRLVSGKELHKIVVKNDVEENVVKGILDDVVASRMEKISKSNYGEDVKNRRLDILRELKEKTRIVANTDGEILRGADPKNEKIYIVGHGIPNGNLFSGNGPQGRNYIDLVELVTNLNGSGLPRGFRDFRLTACNCADSFYPKTGHHSELDASARGGRDENGKIYKPFAQRFANALNMWGFRDAEVTAYHGYGLRNAPENYGELDGRAYNVRSFDMKNRIRRSSLARPFRSKKSRREVASSTQGDARKPVLEKPLETVGVQPNEGQSSR